MSGYSTGWQIIGAFALVCGCGRGEDNVVSVGSDPGRAEAMGGRDSDPSVDWNKIEGVTACGGSACAESSQCSPDGRCVECLSDEQCGGKFCSELGLCGDCETDEQCESSGKVCDNAVGLCTEPCVSDDDCSARCDPSRGLCVECLADDDCSERCVPEQLRCSECTTDSHCQGGEVALCDLVSLECWDD